jgi:hypothetical protein
MHYKLFFVLVIFLTFSSCKKENRCDCVKSTGPINVINRNLKDFNCILLKDKIDLYLTQGSDFEVKVEAGSNLQSLIKTEIDGETLKVFNENRCNWVRGYKHRIKVYVTAPFFKHIKHQGVGTIESINTLVQDTISLRIENSGDIKLDLQTYRAACSAHGNGDTYLTGKTYQLASDFTGTNFLYASGLTISSYTYLHSVSIGNAFINAPENGLMDIVLDRAGNVHYTGNPSTINLTRNSKGNLIKD